MSEEKPETRVQLTRQLWESLEKQHVIGIAHYNALLGVYVENEHSFSMEETLTDLKARNLYPNHFTFQRIVENYGRNGDMDGVEKAVAVMEENQVKVNNYTYNSLILAYGLAG